MYNDDSPGGGRYTAPAEPARDRREAHSAGLLVNGFRHVKRVVVMIVGGLVLLAGVIMLVTPGPGLVGIALGLGILSTEFAWARRLLHRFKEKYMNARAAIRSRRRGSGANARGKPGT
jgi:uncharacterized protein (TIGR02611 family)